MNRLSGLDQELRESSDRDNPTAEELERLLREARHIAVIGLSRHGQKAARRVPSYMAAKGYDVVPVNPHAERILGRRSYPSLRDVPEPIDLIVIFRPSDVAGSFVRQAMEREGEAAIWLQTGIRADEEVAEARASGRTVVQDMCLFRVHRALEQ